MDLYEHDKVSDHFYRSEFACKCGCGFASVDYKLLAVLELVRTNAMRPVTITSACRCEAHNKAVGGSDGSLHKKGMAADIVVSRVPPKEVYDFLCEQFPNKFGMGLYDDFVHIDVRPTKARWQA